MSAADSPLDRANKTIRLASGGEESVPATQRSLGYDTLVIAVGSVASDFSTPGAAEDCIFLDTPEQASRFHRQLLSRLLWQRYQPAAKPGSDPLGQTLSRGAGNVVAAVPASSQTWV